MMPETGTCPVCLATLALTPGGKVATHYEQSVEPYKGKRCTGSLKRPRTAEQMIEEGLGATKVPSVPESGSTAPSQQQFLSAPERKKSPPRERQPLEGEAAVVSEWFDEMFFAYQHNRPRSMQAAIGPSEAGSACVRRIAMKLCQADEVNLERDSWAAWMGTQGHGGLERMLRWANERFAVPRYLVESPVTFGSTAMPQGHLDGFDRKFGRVIDWKFPGRSALGKMHLDGCPVDYRVQLHLYGLGLEAQGETVRQLCLIGLPREGGTLADKYVYVEQYNRAVAQTDLARVESIDARLTELGRDWRQAPKTPSYLCPYCSFYLPNDTAETKGCSA